jgi:hypothetical protein
VTSWPGVPAPASGPGECVALRSIGKSKSVAYQFDFSAQQLRGSGAYFLSRRDFFAASGRRLQRHQNAKKLSHH